MTYNGSVEKQIFIGFMHFLVLDSWNCGGKIGASGV